MDETEGWEWRRDDGREDALRDRGVKFQQYIASQIRHTRVRRRYSQSELLAKMEGLSLGMYHGSPEDRDETLFSNTPDERFIELSRKCSQDVIITGHSHSPYAKKIQGLHFINPGSSGRMFDGNPAASYAILNLKRNSAAVALYRCPFDINLITLELERQGLPNIYKTMFEQGRKLN